MKKSMFKTITGGPMFNVYYYFLAQIKCTTYYLSLWKELEEVYTEQWTSLALDADDNQQESLHFASVICHIICRNNNT